MIKTKIKQFSCIYAHFGTELIHATLFAALPSVLHLPLIENVPLFLFFMIYFTDI